MLTTIREKAQGTLAKGMLMAICATFVLWGIQNYLDNGSEPPVVTVGDKDFYQRDVNKAYEKYRQNLQGMDIDEQMLKKQALDKLIKDEVLLQYVREEGLVVTDESVRNFIKKLPISKPTVNSMTNFTKSCCLRSLCHLRNLSAK